MVIRSMNKNNKKIVCKQIVLCKSDILIVYESKKGVRYMQLNMTYSVKIKHYNKIFKSHRGCGGESRASVMLWKSGAGL